MRPSDVAVVAGLVVGTAVWAGIAGAVVAWLALTLVWRRLPHAGEVVRWLLSSWLGRALALAAWAGAGWHIFCQRP